MYIEKIVYPARHIGSPSFRRFFWEYHSLGRAGLFFTTEQSKVLEESPSVVISASKRQELGAAAVRAAQAVGYRNAGTIEFLMDEAGEFYFMEMNTRIQVEHPITEMVTNIDLVKKTN